MIVTSVDPAALSKTTEPDSVKLRGLGAPSPHRTLQTQDATTLREKVDAVNAQLTEWFPPQLSLRFGYHPFTSWPKRAMIEG